MIINIHKKTRLKSNTRPSGYEPNINKQKTRQKTGFHCSGGWIWTSDLRVM